MANGYNSDLNGDNSEGKTGSEDVIFLSEAETNTPEPENKEEAGMANKKKTTFTFSSNGKKIPKKYRKKKVDGATWFLIIGSALILIPIIWFAVILLQADAATGKAIIGDRFEGDLNPAITQTQINEVVASLQEEPEIAEVQVILKVATFRVYIKVEPGLSSEQYLDLIDRCYDKVTAILPVDIYFSVINDIQKQYDMEIHVYNMDKDDGTDNFTYYLMVKSSNMAAPSQPQLVSEPVDPELAKELQDSLTQADEPEKITDGDGEIQTPDDSEEEEGTGE
ncbi:MAG: hypothetical protein LBR25_04685 [Erysipelotrichaceae bacterium]|jgi:hypothetical protein|nr:hypothetical protein [Erysipelotrichaceae bacterium]